MKLEKIPLKDLISCKHNLSNPKYRRGAGLDLERGLLAPLDVWFNGTLYEIMDGHRRWLRANELQWAEIPCIVHDELKTEDDVKNWCDRELPQRAELPLIDRVRFIARKYEEWKKQQSQGVSDSFREFCKQNPMLARSTWQRYYEMRNLADSILEEETEWSLAHGEPARIRVLDQILQQTKGNKSNQKELYDKVKNLMTTDALQVLDMEEQIEAQKPSNIPNFTMAQAKEVEIRETENPKKSREQIIKEVEEWKEMVSQFDGIRVLKETIEDLKKLAKIRNTTYGRELEKTYSIVGSAWINEEGVLPLVDLAKELEENRRIMSIPDDEYEFWKKFLGIKDPTQPIYTAESNFRVAVKLSLAWEEMGDCVFSRSSLNEQQKKRLKEIFGVE